jgi:hypothetical protein
MSCYYFEAHDLKIYLSKFFVGRQSPGFFWRGNGHFAHDWHWPAKIGYPANLARIRKRRYYTPVPFSLLGREGDPHTTIRIWRTWERQVQRNASPNTRRIGAEKSYT